MRRVKKLAALAAVALLAACGGPKIIPDRELIGIFHDMYLVNAYVDFNRLATDSLNIYEPVLTSYGYTSEDLQYTIGNFAKRKSARLADDVVEPANQLLLAESRHYRRRVEIDDTVRLIAKKKFAREVYADSLIRVARVADTSRLRIAIDDIHPGNYNISYGYRIDSLDRNYPFRAEVRLMNAASRVSNSSSPRLSVRGERSTVSTDIATTADDRRLVVVLNVYPRDLSKPDITIDSLRVTYYLPDEVAVPKLRRSVYAGGLLDSLLSTPERHETNLLPPLIDTAGVRTR